MSSNPVETNKPRLFEPSVRRGLQRSKKTAETSFGSISDSNMESTSSFRYDSYGKGIKSTQQIPINWAKFENHTFFNSAEAKINVAFDRIINHFPFDGKKKEIEAFMDSLTGFEKWVFDRFPKNTGFLMFSGSSKVTSAEGYTHFSCGSTRSRIPITCTKNRWKVNFRSWS